MAIPLKKDNPDGLHQRYRVKTMGGQKTPNGADYFVLRLDGGGGDPAHIVACRKAINVYADHIEATLPALAADIRAKYPVSYDVDSLLEELSRYLLVYEVTTKPGTASAGFVALMRQAKNALTILDPLATFKYTP